MKMEWTPEIWGLIIYCLSYSQVLATIPRSCNTQLAYTSPFVQAFTSDEAAIFGCSAQVDETSREVHVINLKSSEEDLLHTNHVMTLNIGPRTLHMRTTIVVLNSVHPVTWKLVTQHDVGPLLFQFVVSLIAKDNDDQ
ncbi:transforming growth factor beta receptor type 3-like [Lytechinus variegatus]|uniref:transforming growth factor beta receptor type 3-like n=1 Tax=Lytechinus variegatus TaxID=7654 RepID=UPI001BB1407B|nr:transforming growth factor beta receptor type 3-like [Lytechinus variegatus]XP_041482103.1 transforming growth factor beta receptor type 3-like [Lytechinus variegatus]